MARHTIEVHAQARFAHLARRMAPVGAPDALVELALRAARDEGRHAMHCSTIARRHGALDLDSVPPVLEYAPRSLSPAQRVLYDVVAQSCVAETQSTSTLVTLMDAAVDGELAGIVQELARDEVQHGRLGWAYLAWAREHMDVGFLGELLPGMLKGNAGLELFAAAPPELDEPELYRYGVVPHSTRRHLYVETLVEVIFPGFELHGIDTASARHWLEAQHPAA